MIFVENLYKSLSYSESVDAFLKAGFLLQQRYVVMCHRITYVLLRNMRCISHKKGLKRGFCQKSPQLKVDQQKIDLLEIESAKNRSVKSRLSAKVDDVVILGTYTLNPRGRNF